MVHEFFVRQVSESGERHLNRLTQLQTKADAEQYVRDAQTRIRGAFGPEPERTPLNPRVTSTVERDTYRIENVIFDSRPGFPVTANLYIPNGHSGPMPATDIHLVGRGWGVIAATFAAVMSDQVTQVTLKNALMSYTHIAESEHYNWPLSMLLPNVLARFDLPDCFAELNSKNLRRIDSWGAEPPGE